MSLRLRLVVSLAVPLAFSMVFGCMLAGWHAVRSVQTELTAALEVGEQTVRDAVKERSSVGEPTHELRRLIRTFDGNRHVRATLLDPRGAVLARSRLFPPAFAVPGWFGGLIDPQMAPVDVSVPLGTADRLIIRLATDPTNEAGEVWGDFRDAILALFVFCVLALAFISWTVRRLLRPVIGLISGLSRIGSGDYSARVAEEGPPEFAALASGFNRTAARLAAIEAQNLRLHEQLSNLQEEERADLARDLHDEIGPSLFAVSMTAATIGELAKAGRSNDIPEQVRAISEVIARAQRHIRDLLGRLWPLRAIELGLCPAVESLIAFWRAHCPAIVFSVVLSVDEATVPDPLKETIYRIVQEGLSNAVRHGRPSRIEIAIRDEAGEIVVRVSDNGAGSASALGPGFGLRGMRERLAALAGTLSIESGRTGAGWGIVARLPLPAVARQLATLP